jgi:hypothetical protein
MRWQQKLTKKLRAHLRSLDTCTLTQVRANIEFQNNMTFPCWDCVEIARRLDIPCPLTAFNLRCARERRVEKELNGE